MDVEKQRAGGGLPGLIINSALASGEADDIGRPVGFKWESTGLPAIDYVLVYRDDPKDDERGRVREVFLETLLRKRPGIEIERYEHNDGEEHLLVFVKIYAPFNVLAREAEKLKLEMALDKTISPLEEFSLTAKVGQCCNLIEDDEEDYISGPFTRKNFHLFKGQEDKETFFRPALRSYLVNNILINLDIGAAASKVDADVSKTALPKLLHHQVFLDAFILHEASKGDPWIDTLKEDWLKTCPGDYKLNRNVASDADVAKGKRLNGVLQVGDCRFDYYYPTDERERLNRVWTRVDKYQPLDRVRNYFGEKIAFYFAWSGHMITMLWFPTIVGFAIFIYGLIISIQRRSQLTLTATAAPNVTTTVASDAQNVISAVDNMLATIKEAFDNLLTPIFAIIICLWGTFHTELWKRSRSTLAYEWDVDNYEHSEPDRPEFKGTKERLDPITGRMDSYYPGSQQAIKFATSFLILLVMICIVFIGVAAVILYQIFISVKVCPRVNSTTCLILNTIIGCVMNAVFIIVIGKIYDKIAYVLTNWENHRTQSEYDNALILKLFAFQFANSYSSLFYIAFFRGSNVFIPVNGVFNMGPEFVDTCGTEKNCMSMLSMQVLILMITKPLPKLLTDQVIPFGLSIFRSCRKRCSRGQVEAGGAPPVRPTDVNAFIVNEYQKFSLEDFTIEEYMEKIIQLGYLMLFAASFPLAPLIALLTNLFDISTDAHRMLWVFRRPVALIVQDIGVWQDIVEFMNIAGVISNACLIAFTASWTRRPEFDDTFNNMTARLAIILLVENVILGLKFFISAVIPDVPSLVQLQIRRESYRVPKILNSGNINVISDGEESECSLVSLPNLAAEAKESSKDFGIKSKTPAMTMAAEPQPREETDADRQRKQHRRRHRDRDGGGDDRHGGPAAAAVGGIENAGADLADEQNNNADRDRRHRRHRHRRRDDRRRRSNDEDEAAAKPPPRDAAAVQFDNQPPTERSTEDDEARGYQPFGENSAAGRHRQKVPGYKARNAGAVSSKLAPVLRPSAPSRLSSIVEDPAPPDDSDQPGDISLRQFGRHDTKDLTTDF